MHDLLNMVNLQIETRPHEFLQIALHVLHHDVQLLEVVVVLGLQDLDDLHDRGVVQFTHKGDFSENAFAIYFIFEDIFNSFNCYLNSS